MAKYEDYDEFEEGDKECPRCKEALTVTRRKGRVVASERHSGKQHVCWDLPADANLIVIDD